VYHIFDVTNCVNVITSVGYIDMRSIEYTVNLKLQRVSWLENVLLGPLFITFLATVNTTNRMYFCTLRLLLKGRLYELVVSQVFQCATNVNWV
jgi:DUF1365 family protein